MCFKSFKTTQITIRLSEPGLVVSHDFDVFKSFEPARTTVRLQSGLEGGFMCLLC